MLKAKDFSPLPGQKTPRTRSSQRKTDKQVSRKGAKSAKERYFGLRITIYE